MECETGHGDTSGDDSVHGECAFGDEFKALHVLALLFVFQGDQRFQNEGWSDNRYANSRLFWHTKLRLYAVQKQGAVD